MTARKSGKKNIFLALLLTVLVLAISLGVVFQSFTYGVSHSETVIDITYLSEKGGVSIYVSGLYVRRGEDGKYYLRNPESGEAEKSRIAVMAVNETRESSELRVIIDGVQHTSESPNYFETEITGAPSVEIQVDVSVPTEQGSAFSAAFPIYTGDDLIALSKILMYVDGSNVVTEQNIAVYNGFLEKFDLEVSAEDGALISVSSVESRLSEAREYLRSAYFRLQENILLNASISDVTKGLTEGYFGIGAMRGAKFSGAFDFNGKYVNMVVTATDMGDAAYGVPAMLSGTADHEVMSIGLFGRVSGDGEHACIIRNANVRGSIAVTSRVSEGKKRIYAGGLAGKIGDGVALENITSSVSLSVTSDNASVYAGGIFGFSSADIEHWSNVSYDGTYATIEARTDGRNADTMVGSLAGIIENAYVRSYSAVLNNANLIANSLGSGNAVAGGLAAICYLASGDVYADCSERGEIDLTDIVMKTSGAVLSAQTNTSGQTPATNIDPKNFLSSDAYGAAVAGGLAGILYNNISAAETERITLSDIHFEESPDSAGKAFTVNASTRAGDSNGITFAGGLIGYIYDRTDNTGDTGIDYVPSDAALDQENGSTIFACYLSVNSKQNGYGPAYAGGIFGYNAFRLRPDTAGTDIYTFNLTDKGADINAVQSSLTRRASQKKEALNDVAAGFYSSCLPNGYYINYFRLNIYNSKVSAVREAGSTAIGDVAAGGLAGQASAENYAGRPFNDVAINLHESTVQALGYSFNSDYGDGNQGNNVFAGGFFGYIEGYGRKTGSTYDYGLKNLSVKFHGFYDDARNDSNYAVYCVQNAVASNPDETDGYGNYCAEGYVGGVIGMLAESNAEELHFYGDEKKSLIYFSATNDPDTAGAGGIIGAVKLFMRSDKGSDPGYNHVNIKNCTAVRAHVAGKAFSNKQTDGGNHDLYVGGGIALLGTCEGGGNHDVSVSGIRVEDCAVEAVGEQKMITYAGGVIGGIYYTSFQKVSDSIGINNSVLASSASYGAISGGFIGLLQAGQLTNCHAIDTQVKSLNLVQSPESEYMRAFAAGICGRNTPTSDYTNSVTGCVTNASVSAVGTNAAKAGICINFAYNVNCSDNYYVTSNVFDDLSDSAVGKYYELKNWWGGTAEALSGYDAGDIVLYNDEARQNPSSHNTLNINNRTSEIFPNTNADMFTLRVLDVNSLVTVGTGGSKTLRAKNNNNKGIVQVTLAFSCNGEEFDLCTYTVTVNNGAPDAGGVYVYGEEGDRNSLLNAENAMGYSVGTTSAGDSYTYLRIHIGKTKDGDRTIVQRVYVSTDNVAYPLMYEVKDGLKGRQDIGIGITAAEAADFIAACSNSRHYSYFKADADIGFSDVTNNEMYFEPLQGAADAYAIVFCYGNEYVIVEVVPNELAKIDVSPAQDTPPRGVIDESTFIYSPGDTVRLDAKTTYLEFFDQYVVDVEFSAAESVGNLDIKIRPNGTVEIGSSVPSGTEISVLCSSVEDSDTRKIVKIIVTESIVVDTGTLTGATYEPNGNVAGVRGQPFTFTLSPTPGYGLNPSVTLERRNGSDITLDTFTFEMPELRIDGNGDVSVDGYVFQYEYNAVSGIYTITLSSEYMDDLTKKIVISADFDKVYTLVFDLGAWADEKERRYTYTLKGSADDNDTVLNGELLNKLEDIYSRAVRAGFSFEGYYSTDDAASDQAYGESFFELCTRGHTLYSSRTFYARWKFKLIFEAPDGVGIVSGTAGSDIIPVNTNRGFSFRFVTESWFEGSPGFDVFIASHGEDGSITGLRKVAFDGVGLKTDESGNYVLGGNDPLFIDGAIVIRVFDDNAAIAVGETDAVNAQSVTIRADGIFTAFYGINSGTGIAREVLDSVSFIFTDGAGSAKMLPSGTSLRLFVHRNGVPYSVGYLSLSEAVSRISVADFKDMDLFGSDEGTVLSVAFYLVAVLPNNENFISGSMTISATYIGNITRGDAVYYNFGEQTPAYGEFLDYGKSVTTEIEFTVATERKITELNGVLRASGIGEPDDRHENKLYMWRIVGENLPETEGEIVRTEEARGSVVYLSADREIDLNMFRGAEEISLLEVTNTRYPSTDIVLDVWR